MSTRNRRRQRPAANPNPTAANQTTDRIHSGARLNAGEFTDLLLLLERRYPVLVNREINEAVGAFNQRRAGGVPLGGESLDPRVPHAGDGAPQGIGDADLRKQQEINRMHAGQIRGGAAGQSAPRNQVERSRSLPGALSTVEQVVCAIEMKLEQLQSALGPILPVAPQPPATAGVEVPRVGDSCSVSNLLYDCAERLVRQCQRIDDLTGRVQV